jgi:hypothetical protein
LLAERLDGRALPIWRQTHADIEAALPTFNMENSGVTAGAWLMFRVDRQDHVARGNPPVGDLATISDQSGPETNVRLLANPVRLR